MSPKSRNEAITAIAEALDVLGDDEVEILLMLSTRLVKGQLGYGALSLRHDTRDFIREAEEENLDRALYEAMHYRRRMRANGRALP